MYYFLFGYHHPDAWAAMQSDATSDLESTGVLPILAEDLAAAHKWGTHLAQWYLSKLYADYPELKYSWSPDDYACWIETSVPEGCHACVHDIGAIQVNSYPDFEMLRRVFQD